jgi:hypothetical protein
VIVPFIVLIDRLDNSGTVFLCCQFQDLVHCGWILWIEQVQRLTLEMTCSGQDWVNSGKRWAFVPRQYHSFGQCGFCRLVEVTE